MATITEFLADAQAYLDTIDTGALDRNQLLAHGALERMLKDLQGSTSLNRFNFDIGSLIRVAGQEVPWGTGGFRVFYSDATFTVPDGVTSMRIWVAAGSGSGAGTLASNATTMQDGTDGGTSSVTGTGIALTALGGGAGLADGTGGAGGTSSGGDENHTGGDGSDGVVDGDCAAAGSGGGHATQWGDGGDAGTGFADDGVRASSGGAGSVFDGGDASEYGAGAGASAFGAGEDATVTSSSSTKGGPDCLGAITQSGTSFYPFNSITKVHPYDGFWYAGGSGVLTGGNGGATTGHGGAGGGAGVNAANSAYDGAGPSSNPGPGAGSGAAVRGNSGSASNKMGGPASGKGGGGGGGGILSLQYATPAKAGGGGGGGGFTRKVCAVTPGQVLAIAVGRGGIGHDSNGADGTGGDGFVFMEW